MPTRCDTPVSVLPFGPNVACGKPLYTDEQARGTCWRCYASGARRIGWLMALAPRWFV